MRKISAILSVVIVLILLLTMGYSRLLFKISMSEHYNVKRGTLVWHVIFKNTSISKVPIVKSINPPQYSYSIDHSQINYDMTIEYDSELEIEELIPIVLSRLRKNGFEINLGSVNCGEWAWRLNLDDNKIKYNGTSPKGECMYLEFQKSENLVKVNVGIAD